MHTNSPKTPPPAAANPLLHAMLNAASPEHAAEVINQHLEAHHAAWRFAPVAPTIGPAELVALAREYGQIDNVHGLFDRNLSEQAARQHFEMARDLKDRFHALGCLHLYAETRSRLTNNGAVDAIVFVAMSRLADEEPEIRSDHSGGYPNPSDFNILEIERQRKSTPNNP